MKRKNFRGKNSTRYKQGFYKPINPEKYKGKVKQIVYRSSWELKMFFKMDRDEDVIQWSSEEVVIPYRSPKDNKYHRYYMDIWCKKADGKEYLYEIKPHSQTKPPVKGKKKEATFLNECLTYSVNKAKWDAAEAYAEKRGMEFLIITEKILNEKNIL